MASNIKLSRVQGEESDRTASGTVDIEESDDKKKKNNNNKIQDFVKIYVRGQLFEMARTTIIRSAFLLRLINDEPNSEDGSYHIDRNPEKFECLMDYLAENQVRHTLPCSVRELYNEALFYGIDLPENNCWGTTLLYILQHINTCDIRGQLKSFADRHGIFGWAEWKQRIFLYVEFHCHRTIELNVVYKYMLDQVSKDILMIKSANETDIRMPSVLAFERPKTCKHHKDNRSLKEEVRPAAYNQEKGLVVEDEKF